MILPGGKIVTVRLTFAFLGVALIIKTADSIEIEDVQFLHKGQICVKILNIDQNYIFCKYFADEKSFRLVGNSIEVSLASRELSYVTVLT